MSKVRIKKEKIVVVDYDDTIGDFLGMLCRLHNKLYGTCVTSHDMRAWDFEQLEVIDARGNVVKGLELKDTMIRYENEIYSSMELLPDALFALDTIKSIGYKIVILTARPDVFRHQTIFNLMTKRIPYDDIIFNWDKVKEIRKLSKTYNIQLFVDDNADTVQNVFDNCKVNSVCLVNRQHNVAAELDVEIIRVGSIMDCIKYLKEVIKS